MRTRSLLECLTAAWAYGKLQQNELNGRADAFFMRQQLYAKSENRSIAYNMANSHYLLSMPLHEII